MKYIKIDKSYLFELVKICERSNEHLLDEEVEKLTEVLDIADRKENTKNVVFDNDSNDFYNEPLSIETVLEEIKINDGDTFKFLLTDFNMFIQFHLSNIMLKLTEEIGVYFNK